MSGLLILLYSKKQVENSGKTDGFGKFYFIYVSFKLSRFYSELSDCAVCNSASDFNRELPLTGDNQVKSVTKILSFTPVLLCWGANIVVRHGWHYLQTRGKKIKVERCVSGER